MSPLVYQTKCTLCNFSITMPGLPDGDVDPQNIPPTVMQLNMKLYEHLQRGAAAESQSLEAAQKYFNKHPDTKPPDLSQTKHLQAFQEIMLRTALAQGSATMWPYDSQDPQFRKMKQMARLRLNTITRKYFFDDKMLLDAVVQLNLDEDQQEMVLKLVTAIRDSLTEQGDYAPENEKALVTLV